MSQHPASRRRLRLFKKRRKQRNRLRSSLRVVPQKKVNKCGYFMFVLCYPISIAFSISTTLLTTLYREKDGICFIGDSFVFLRERICYSLWELSPFQGKQLDGTYKRNADFLVISYFPTEKYPPWTQHRCSHFERDFYVASFAILSFALQNCDICAIFPI